MTELRRELCRWLDHQHVTTANIGALRRACSVPWDSAWNQIVRIETGERENKPPRFTPAEKPANDWKTK